MGLRCLNLLIALLLLLILTFTNCFRMKEVIQQNGYPFQNFTIVTTDGYILELFRIEHGLNGTCGRRPPVLIMHGLLGCPYSFVALGPNRGLAYILADRGYDVWLGNGRGSRYSRKHVSLDPDVNETFWDFSWHENGVYDLPAVIDQIKDVTKQNRVAFIGLSMGTTISYVLASERSEYNNDFSVIISLGPLAFMGNTKSPLSLLLSPFEKLIDVITELSGIVEIPPLSTMKFVANTLKRICHKDHPLVDACVAAISSFAGPDPSQLDKADIVPQIESISPCSIRQLLHYAQLINSGLFSQYDHGRTINLRKYKKPIPPNYNLSKITAPVALFYSSGDWAATAADAEKLCKELPNCSRHKRKMATFNHYDLFGAIDIVPLLFEDVIRVLNKFTFLV